MATTEHQVQKRVDHRVVPLSGPRSPVLILTERAPGCAPGNAQVAGTVHWASTAAQQLPRRLPHGRIRRLRRALQVRRGQATLALGKQDLPQLQMSREQIRLDAQSL